MKNLQDKFNEIKFNSIKDWYVRYQMVQDNPSLATQENYSNEGNNDVRQEMIRVNIPSYAK